MITNTNAKSFEQEKRIANFMGGKRVIGSGATPFLKGDVVAGNLFIEAKTKMEPCKGFRIQKDWIDKAKAQALSTKKGDYALAISFGDDKDYFVIEDTLMRDLYYSREALRAVMEALGGLESKLVKDADTVSVSGLRELIRRHID
jgi:hypothetical protein